MQVYHGSRSAVTANTIRPSRNGVTYYAKDRDYALNFGPMVHERDIDVSANWLDLTSIAPDADIDSACLESELAECGVVVRCAAGEMELAQHLMAIVGFGDVVRAAGFCGVVLREYVDGGGETVAYGLV